MKEQIYQALATIHDPRTDKGMQAAPVHDRVNLSREKAVQFAQQWASEGYWTSVYNQRTAECIVDYSPKGDDR
jgi:hypothetical protein